MAVIPSTSPDYRSLTELLNEAKKEYHTYSLSEDTVTKTVIKGIPINIKTDDVAKDLENHGLPSQWTG